MRSVLSARAVHCSATSLPLQSQTVFFFSIEQEWLKLGLRCLPFTGPIGQVSKVGESLRGLGFPLGTLLLSLQTLLGRTLLLVLSGGRPLGGAAAGSSAGLGPLLSAFPVGRARLHAGFLLCLWAGEGVAPGLHFPWRWFSFPAHKVGV